MPRSSSMSSKAVRREGRADVGKFTTSGLPRRARVHVEPNRPVESGSWNTCRHHQHRHGQYKTNYCGREAPAVATLMLAFAIRTAGHLLTDGMNALRGRKLPACLHAKLDTTATKPEHAAYPAQMLKLRRTHEFPRPSISSQVKKLCGYRHRQTTSLQQPPRRQSSRVAGEPLLERLGHTARPCRTDQQPAATQTSGQQPPTRPSPRSRQPAMYTPRCTSAPSCP